MNEHNIEEINRRIEELKREMSAVQGSDTEVYARIVGYYRSVGNWNRGKREEYNYRKNFVLDGEPAVCVSPGNRRTKRRCLRRLKPRRPDGFSASCGKPVRTALP